MNMNRIFAILAVMMITLTGFSVLGVENADAVKFSHVTLKGYVDWSGTSINQTNVTCYEEIFDLLEIDNELANDTAAPVSGYYEMEFNATFAFLKFEKLGYLDTYRAISFNGNGTYWFNVTLGDMLPLVANDPGTYLANLSGNITSNMTQYGDAFLFFYDVTTTEFIIGDINYTDDTYSARVQGGLPSVFAGGFANCLFGDLEIPPDNNINLTDGEPCGISTRIYEYEYIGADPDDSQNSYTKLNFWNEDDNQLNDLETCEVEVNGRIFLLGPIITPMRIAIDFMLGDTDGYIDQAEADFIQSYLRVSMGFDESLFTSDFMPFEPLEMDDKNYEYVPGSGSVSILGLVGVIDSRFDPMTELILDLVYEDDFDYDGDIDFSYDMSEAPGELEVIFPPYYDIWNVDVTNGEITSLAGVTESTIVVEFDEDESKTILELELQFRAFLDLDSATKSYPSDLSFYIAITDEDSIGGASITGATGRKILGGVWTSTTVKWGGGDGEEDGTTYINVSSNDNQLGMNGWWNDAIILVKVDGEWYKVEDGASNSDINVDINDDFVVIEITGELTEIKIDTNPKTLTVVSDWWKTLNIF